MFEQPQNELIYAVEKLFRDDDFYNEFYEKYKNDFLDSYELKQFYDLRISDFLNLLYQCKDLLNAKSVSIYDKRVIFEL